MQRLKLQNQKLQKWREAKTEETELEAEGHSQRVNSQR
jgi:hypothetical protein